jgi:hypothetical protein
MRRDTGPNRVIAQVAKVLGINQIAVKLWVEDARLGKLLAKGCDDSRVA